VVSNFTRCGKYLEVTYLGTKFNFVQTWPTCNLLARGVCSCEGDEAEVKECKGELHDGMVGVLECIPEWRDTLCPETDWRFGPLARLMAEFIELLFE
jgi:hypothetical protein